MTCGFAVPNAVTRSESRRSSRTFPPLRAGRRAGRQPASRGEDEVIPFKRGTRLVIRRALVGGGPSQARNPAPAGESGRRFRKIPPGLDQGRLRPLRPAVPSKGGRPYLWGRTPAGWSWSSEALHRPPIAKTMLLASSSALPPVTVDTSSKTVGHASPNQTRTRTLPVNSRLPPLAAASG
jgi:hypothetical protein